MMYLLVVPMGKFNFLPRNTRCFSFEKFAMAYTEPIPSPTLNIVLLLWVALVIQSTKLMPPFETIQECVSGWGKSQWVSPQWTVGICRINPPLFLNRIHLFPECLPPASLPLKQLHCNIFIENREVNEGALGAQIVYPFP